MLTGNIYNVFRLNCNAMFIGLTVNLIYIGWDYFSSPERSENPQQCVLMHSLYEAQQEQRDGQKMSGRDF